MDAKLQSPTILPPRLIPAMVGGFNAVATRIYLILPPILLDVLLWFGPHLRLKSLLSPFIQQISSLPGFNTPDYASLAGTYQEMWGVILERFNLLSLLRTYPVGIPSLMVRQSPIETPFGQPGFIEMTSVGAVLTVWLLVLLVGLVGGTFYFWQIAQAVTGEKKAFSPLLILRSILQVSILSITSLILLIIVLSPVMIFVPILALINPLAAQFGGLLMLMVIVWIIVPFLFSPHGIFVFSQNALASMWTSARMVRYSMGGTATFFLIAFLLSEGMDMLWSVPPSNSWMTAVGIAGHAFIVTGAVAASFIYYRDCLRWAQEMIQQRTKIA